MSQIHIEAMGKRKSAHLRQLIVAADLDGNIAMGRNFVYNDRYRFARRCLVTYMKSCSVFVNADTNTRVHIWEDFTGNIEKYGLWVDDVHRPLLLCRSK